MAIASGPDSPRMRVRRSAISESAVSQSTGRHRPPPRSPSRLSGVSSREGWYMISAAASPLGHIWPRLNGEPGAGRTFTTRPSRTCSRVEQPPWHPRQTEV